MALELQDNVTGKRSETEALNLISGADDCMVIKAGETLNGLTQNLRIVAFVANEDTVIGSLIADDVKNAPGTEVIAGVTKGFKNLNGVTLGAGAFISGGRYKISRTFQLITVTTGSVIAYYNYVTGNEAVL